MTVFLVLDITHHNSWGLRVGYWVYWSWTLLLSHQFSHRFRLRPGQVDRPAIAVPFSYTITGWGLSDVDRIRIVDSTTICGQAGAEVQPGGLEGWEIGRSWQVLAGCSCWILYPFLFSQSIVFFLNVWYSHPKKEGKDGKSEFLVKWREWLFYLFKDKHS